MILLPPVVSFVQLLFLTYQVKAYSNRVPVVSYLTALLLFQ